MQISHHLKTVLSVSKFFLIFFISTSCLNTDKIKTAKFERIIWSPYMEINWDKIGHYDSEFHTHPGLGDEEYDPHQTIDRYKDEGYQILSLAAHDYDIPKDHMKTIYPWTKLSEIYNNIKDVGNPTENNKTYGEMANEPYQDRNPLDLNMISVEGNEVSGPHHIVSLFCSVNSGEKDEAATLQKIKEKGGLAYFAHPGRYVETQGYNEYWYADLYLRFDNLIGQAIFNRKDSYPSDRSFYDKIVHLLGVARPIWLNGEDDMHRESDLGWNRDVILLENFTPGSMHFDIPNGSAPDVFNALKNGYSYLWKPKLQYEKRSFKLKNIEFRRKEIVLSVDNKEEVFEIRWITHNPDSGVSETIFKGSQINLTEIPEYAKFVRAEIEGKKGTIYTQPFYILRNN